MALLEESGKTGVCFYYPMGGWGADYLRATPFSTYQKVGVYFAAISAAVLVFGIFLLAFFPNSDNLFISFAGLVFTYGLIRIIVLYPKMSISRSKIRKASPDPLYAVFDQSCFFLALTVMEWLFMRQLHSGQTFYIGLVALFFIALAILPLINLVILLIKQGKNI